MAKTEARNPKPTREEIRRALAEARQLAHERLAYRQARVDEVLERSERVQERLRRRAAEG